MRSPVRAPLVLVALLTTAAVPACYRDDPNPLSPGRLSPEADQTGAHLLSDDPSGPLRGAIKLAAGKKKIVLVKPV